MKPLTWDHELFKHAIAEADAKDRLLARLATIASDVRRGDYDIKELVEGAGWGDRRMGLLDMAAECQRWNTSVGLVLNSVRAKRAAAEGRKKAKRRSQK